MDKSNYPSILSVPRRVLLRRGLALIGMVALTEIIRLKNSHPETVLLASRIVKFSFDDAQAVHKAVMRIEQDELHRRELEQLLCGVFNVPYEQLHGLANLGDPDLRHRLVIRIQHDFAVGRTAFIGNWWLAATELRLLKLTNSLLSAGSSLPSFRKKSGI